MPKVAGSKKEGALPAETEQLAQLSSPAPSAAPQASIRPKELSSSSQQSRFHVADTAASNQLIDIKAVNVSVGPRDLLQDAHVQLQAGMTVPHPS